MSTNSSLTYALLLPDAVTIKVQYVLLYSGEPRRAGDNFGKKTEYTYKALNSMGIQRGDIVVVPVSHDRELIMVTAKVTEVDEFLDVNTTKDYHWVVARVDPAKFDELREKEKVVAKHLQLRERAAAREQLLKQLFENNEQENALRRELGLEEVPAANNIIHEQP